MNFAPHFDKRRLIYVCKLRGRFLVWHKIPLALCVFFVVGLADVWECYGLSSTQNGLRPRTLRFLWWCYHASFLGSLGSF